MEDFLKQLQEFFGVVIPNTSGLAMTFVVLLGVFALVDCFLGYKLFRFLTALTGATVGLCLGAGMTALILPASDNKLMICLIVGGVLAVVGAALAYKFYKAGVFVFSFMTVSQFVYKLPLVSENIENNALKLVIGLAVGIIIAIFAVKYMHVWLICLTSVSGGFLSAVYLVPLFNFNLPWLVYAVGAVLAIAGLCVQFATGKKNRR